MLKLHKLLSRKKLLKFFMNEFLQKVKSSFQAANRGEETMRNLMWRWGATGYCLAYFVIDPIIKAVNIHAIDVIISLLAVCYFAWHFYVIKKCMPKEPKLSPEEKKKIRQEKRKELPKKLLRKIMLQEPISKFDPIFTVKIVDLFCIAIFLGYVFN